MQKRRPVMLVVLDGWGWREDRANNAVLQAKTPTFDRLWATCPHGFLRTSGKDVGLPDGQMGNSEVGHLNIGAGRVVMQDLPRIDDAIASGEIAKAPAVTGLIAKLKASGGTCHLIGLVSPGGVHSHQNHAVALAKILTDAKVPVVVHALTDGRDTPPQAAAGYLKSFTAALPPSAKVATVIGRYYAMDRDKRWERVSKAYDAIVSGEGPRFADPQAAIADAYVNKVTDEFIVPAAIDDYSGMKDGDGVLCFNFRADRVREILDAMLDPAFGASEWITAPAPVWMPQPSGPMSSKGTSLRIFTTLRSDAIAFSAKEDWQKKQPPIGPSFELSGDDPSTRVPLRFRA